MNYYLGIKFKDGAKAYNFSTDIGELLPGDNVVVETIHGLELGEVINAPMPIEKYSSALELKPIIRQANSSDLIQFENNKLLAAKARPIFEEEVKLANLDMNLVDCEYTLDASKAVFTYVADDRVDFRNLLKSLAPRLRCRIELRQIGARDKAKLYGDIGICGREICCSLFLNEFDGISISRAKNQMLSINIPKLSGQCGKLMCCLKFEDDQYSELKKEFPPLGTRVTVDGTEYTVTSFNVLSKIVKCENADNSVFVELNKLVIKPRKEYKPNPTYKDKK